MMASRQRLTVLLLLLLDVVIVGVVAGPNGGWSGAASPAGVVSMLEASGAPGGDSAWQVVAASSLTPCTTSKTATPSAVLVNATGSYVVLQGVTPHVIARGHILGVNHNKGAGYSSSLLVDVSGDGIPELLLRSAANATAYTVAFSSDCSSAKVTATLKLGASSTSSSSPLGGMAWLPPSTASATSEGGHLVVAAPSGSPLPVLVFPFSASGTPSGGTGSRLCLPQSVATVSLMATGQVTDTAATTATTNPNLVLVSTTSSGRSEVFVLESPLAASCAVVATATLATTSAQWVSASVASLQGDAASMVTLTTSAPHDNNLLMLGYNGTATLQEQAWERHDRPGVAWAGAAAVPWLATTVPLLPGEQQLLVLRAQGPAVTNAVFEVQVLLYGRSTWFRKRATALEGSLAQYAFGDSMQLQYPLNTTAMVAWFEETHTNTYSYLVCDRPASDESLYDYAQFISLLSATAALRVDGTAFRVWITLIPPTELTSDHCMVPPDDPRTPFNETAFFDPALGYGDYVGWAALLGQVAALFPHFVAMQVDDMSHNIAPPSQVFTPDVVARMTSALRGAAPWMTLVPTMYYNQGGSDAAHFVWNLWPDFAGVVDSVLFYFRNQKQGAGPCANPVCPWGPRMHERTGGCLAGACADATVQNAPGEIADMMGGMPPGRRIQVGFYATGHSSLGKPTPRYMLNLMTTVTAQEGVAGITVYRMQVPPAGDTVSGAGVSTEVEVVTQPGRHRASAPPPAVCQGRNATLLEGCIVANVFGSLQRV